ncbi:MAG: CPBP family intramembrane metalloprotease, partial [Bacteroides sp]|nr:CPBP family intramembrane metalloprotease [Bacteroides sp.]
MVRTIKLVIYYFLYQLLFTTIVTIPTVWVQLMNNGGDVNAFTGAETSTTMVGLTMVLSGIAMIWHLIH